MFNGRLNTPQFITYTLARVTQAPITIFLAAYSKDTFKFRKNKMYFVLQFYLFIYLFMHFDGSRIFSSPNRADIPWAKNRPLPPFSGHRKFLPGIKRSRHEVDHLPPSSAEVKNKWRFTSVSAYMDKLIFTCRLVGWSLGYESEWGRKFTSNVDQLETSMVQSSTLNLRYFAAGLLLTATAILICVGCPEEIL